MTDGQLQKAFEVKLLRNRREFEGEIWIDVFYTNGEWAVLKEEDLTACDIDALLEKPREPRRKRRRRRKGKHAAETEVQPPEAAQQGLIQAQPSPAREGGPGSGDEGEGRGDVEAGEDGIAA